MRKQANKIAIFPVHFKGIYQNLSNNSYFIWSSVIILPEAKSILTGRKLSEPKGKFVALVSSGLTFSSLSIHKM
jgi:hypothetical protein